MNNPYYKLGPIKEEIIHLSPNIWMYHDVASPLERRGIIETAGPFVSQTVIVKSLKTKSGMKLWSRFVATLQKTNFYSRDHFLRTDAVFFCIRFVRVQNFCNYIKRAVFKENDTRF